MLSSEIFILKLYIMIRMNIVSMLSGEMIFFINGSKSCLVNFQMT